MSIIILTNHTPIKYENQYILSKIYITYSYKSVTNQKALKRELLYCYGIPTI